MFDTLIAISLSSKMQEFLGDFYASDQLEKEFVVIIKYCAVSSICSHTKEWLDIPFFVRVMIMMFVKTFDFRKKLIYIEKIT